MKKLETFEEIRKENRLLYEYIRGSKAYGTCLESSDEDHGGIYMETEKELLGSWLPSGQIQQEISDDKHDVVWYKFGRFMELLRKSNPNILESIFIPDNCVIYEHPIITELKKSRDIFITKNCFKPFIGYSIQQLKKARSLGKKVAQPDEQPQPFLIDSVFTFYKQGSIPIKTYLNKRGLNQKYCGLVNIPNCTSNLSCFYDWGAHISKETNIKTFSDFEGWINNGKIDDLFRKYVIDRFKLDRKYDSVRDIWDKYFSISRDYHGIVKSEEEINPSKQLRLSSVNKGEEPICIISYDSNAYTQRCIKYKEWQNWKACRNEERYKEVLDKKGYDVKNATHCLRLMNMGIEIAKGEGIKVDRRGIDADYLLKVRTGQFTFEEIMTTLDEKQKELEKVINNSRIPDDIDLDVFEDLVYNLRNEFFKGK